MHWISSVPLGVTISMIGLLGNAVSVYIWYRILKKKIDSGSSTSIYLIALGIIDFLLLLFFLLTNSLPSAFPEIIHSYAYAAFYSYIGFPFLYFFIVASIWLLVGVTFSRFIIVKAPLKARVWCTPSKTLLGISIIGGSSFIINIPHFFNYYPGSVNGTYQICETDYAKTGGSESYEFWVHCMVLVLVPWFGLFILNSSIIWSMRERAVNTTKMFADGGDKKQERVKQQHQITKMLLFVTFAFIILLGWQCVSQCIWMIGSEASDTNWDIIDRSFAVAKLGIVINSSINWLLYCLTGSAFRKEIFKIYYQHSSIVTPDESRSSGGKSLNNTENTQSANLNKESS